MSKSNIEFKCVECGSEQSEKADESNENWKVYNCNQKCNCGGEYYMHIDGVPLKGGE